MVSAFAAVPVFLRLGLQAGGEIGQQGSLPEPARFGDDVPGAAAVGAPGQDDPFFQLAEGLQFPDAGAAHHLQQGVPAGHQEGAHRRAVEQAGHQVPDAGGDPYPHLLQPAAQARGVVRGGAVAPGVVAVQEDAGVCLQQRLDAIYASYGYSTEVVFSNEYEGAAGKEKMASIMASMRALKKGDTLVGRQIESVEDLKSGNTGFPKADVIIIRFASGEKLVVRPSGTEPKIKYYLFLSEGPDGRKALEEKVGSVKAEFMAAL